MSKLTKTRLGNYAYNVKYGTANVGEFLLEIHGEWVWYPNNRGGFLTAWFLRLIADELDSMNHPLRWGEDLFFSDYTGC